MKKKNIRPLDTLRPDQIEFHMAKFQTMFRSEVARLEKQAVRVIHKYKKGEAALEDMSIELHAMRGMLLSLNAWIDNSKKWRERK